jgi:hypothetical protein
MHGMRAAASGDLQKQLERLVESVAVIQAITATDLSNH